MFYMHAAGWGWGWWLVMSVGMIAFWALIIYGIVWLLRGRPAEDRDQARPQPPEQILKRRLAQGEISVDEYERRHAAIRETPRNPTSPKHEQTAA